MASLSSSLPVNKESKEDVTVGLLTAFKWLISEGTLSSGARLPAQRRRAEQFQERGSCQQPALQVLEVMGVIAERVGDGTYIADGGSSVLAESLEFLILLSGIA